MELLHMLEKKYNTKVSADECSVIQELVPQALTVKHQMDWWSVKMNKDGLQTIMELFGCYQRLRVICAKTVASFVTQQDVQQDVMELILSFAKKEKAAYDKLMKFELEQQKILFA